VDAPGVIEPESNSDRLTAIDTEAIAVTASLTKTFGVDCPLPISAALISVTFISRE
jgi:hypothetical protein